MSYKSPIEVFQTQMQSQIVGEIYKAVMKVGVNVDKEELLKALQYDREQYQKGYKDRDEQIIRCRDCRHGEKSPTFRYYPELTWCNKHSTSHNDEWFCADGERRDDNG